MNFLIKPLDKNMMDAASERQHNLAKPFGSLGQLEGFSVRLAGITGELFPSLDNKAVVVFASDNGVWEEGITPIGKDVTALQSANMTYGKAGIGVLCAHAKAKLIVVDVGINDKYESRYILRRNVRRSTSNIAKGPAMTCQEFERCFEIGKEMAQKCKEQGMKVVGAGEMGVGNTTTSTAVIAAITNLPLTEITGRGAGLSDKALENKLNVIRRALDINKPDSKDACDVIKKVGGFDIASMTAFYLASAELNMAVVVDGYIAMAAALCAYKINPLVRDYMFLSHRSAEPGYDYIARELELKPMLDLDMRLGEGTGCPLAFNILDAAARVLRDMSTFAEISINDSVIEDNWEQKKGI